MSLSLEINIIVRSLCFCVSKGSTETPNGLAWKSDRGLRTSFPLRAGIWLAGSRKEAWRCCSGSSSMTSLEHENEEQGKVSGSDKKPSRREKGSLSTLIVLFESRVTDRREPVSKEGVCRSMDSLLGHTCYTRR
jgi:hypothetical protein